MSDVDVALNDEGQQYGNLDESSAIARVPRKGLAKTQNPKQVSLNPKAQLPQITSPANLLLDTRTRTNQEGWQSFSL